MRLMQSFERTNNANKLKCIGMKFAELIAHFKIMKASEYALGRWVGSQIFFNKELLVRVKFRLQLKEKLTPGKTSAACFDRNMRICFSLIFLIKGIIFCVALSITSNDFNSSWLAFLTVVSSTMSLSTSSGCKLRRKKN